MTTLIFVHGTGGRNHKYIETYQEIKKKLQTHQQMQQFNLQLSGCLWGDDHGANLNKSGGKSIPKYDFSASSTSQAQNDRIVLWQKLRDDPMWEILLLFSNKSPTELGLGTAVYPGGKFHEKVEQVKALPDNVATIFQEEVKSQLVNEDIAIAEVIEVFKTAYPQAYREVTTHSYYEKLKEVIPAGELPNIYYEAVVRAIIAKVWIQLESEYVCNPISDAEFRDNLISLLAEKLTEGFEEKGFSQPVVDILKKIYLRPGQWILKNRGRTALMDTSYPAAGDIVLYQARGAEIRQFIKAKIRAASSPVILLAHSLGGIACVDLLVDPRDKSEFISEAPLGDDDLEFLSKVKLLITVGSQAPFLYEINALQSLPYAKPLPTHFPRRWLNIYNRYDILSYLAYGVFPTAGSELPIQITDKELVKPSLFPDAHTEYWKQEKMWDIVAQELQLMQDEGKIS
jgi:hypothetical protein